MICGCVSKGTIQIHENMNTALFMREITVANYPTIQVIPWHGSEEAFDHDSNAMRARLADKKRKREAASEPSSGHASASADD